MAVTHTSLLISRNHVHCKKAKCIQINSISPLHIVKIELFNKIHASCINFRKSRVSGRANDHLFLSGLVRIYCHICALQNREKGYKYFYSKRIIRLNSSFKVYIFIHIPSVWSKEVPMLYDFVEHSNKELLIG